MSGRAARWALALAILGAWIAARPARGETPEEMFARGNQAYEKGRYAEASEAYRTVLEYGVVDARVDYNLGNAEFKQGRLGEAIFHYLRAHRLGPTDPDIAANLELARSRCVDRVEVPEAAGIVRWTRSVQDRLGPDRQAVAWLVLVWVAASIVGWCASRPGDFRPAAGWTLAAVLLLACLLAWSWSATYDRLEGTRLAVVLRPVQEVLAGPGENNAGLFTVHEGLTLEVRGSRQDWVQVSLPNGFNGWVPRDALGIL